MMANLAMKKFLKVRYFLEVRKVSKDGNQEIS